MLRISFRLTDLQSLEYSRSSTKKGYGTKHFPGSNRCLKVGTDTSFFFEGERRFLQALFILMVFGYIMDSDRGIPSL